jgi:hypothetical protein
MVGRGLAGQGWAHTANKSAVCVLVVTPEHSMLEESDPAVRGHGGKVRAGVGVGGGGKGGVRGSC